MCVVGQTTNLRKRFNQYATRSRKNATATDRINNRLSAAAREAFVKGFGFSQVFQRYVVFTWVDEKGKPINVTESFNLRNQMSYLEHRLILAFFECGLCYNINDAFPQLTETLDLPLLSEEDLIKRTERLKEKRVLGPNHAKPFTYMNLYFFSRSDYERYRNGLAVEERKKFLSFPCLREKLRLEKQEIRYLTAKEITEILAKNFFQGLK